MGWCLHPIWAVLKKKNFRYANLSALPLSYTPHFPNPRNIPDILMTLAKRIAYIICHLALVIFLHYPTLHKNQNLCCLPLISVSGSEKSRLCG